VASTDRPTAKQLALLRQLAADRGQTFTYPQTRRQASREIARLLEAEAPVPEGAECDRDATAEKQLDATRVQDDEVSGHGSSARWRRGR
jgi:hypothetical protein